MCGRRQNYDSFWFILDGHDDKVKDQCHGAIMKLKRKFLFRCYWMDQFFTMEKSILSGHIDFQIVCKNE